MRSYAPTACVIFQESRDKRTVSAVRQRVFGGDVAEHLVNAADRRDRKRVHDKRERGGVAFREYIVAVRKRDRERVSICSEILVCRKRRVCHGDGVLSVISVHESGVLDRVLIVPVREFAEREAKAFLRKRNLGRIYRVSERSTAGVVAGECRRNGVSARIRDLRAVRTLYGIRHAVNVFKRSLSELEAIRKIRRKSLAVCRSERAAECIRNSFSADFGRYVARLHGLGSDRGNVRRKLDVAAHAFVERESNIECDFRMRIGSIGVSAERDLYAHESFVLITEKCLKRSGINAHERFHGFRRVAEYDITVAERPAPCDLRGADGVFGRTVAARKDVVVVAQRRGDIIGAGIDHRTVGIGISYAEIVLAHDNALCGSECRLMRLTVVIPCKRAPSACDFLWRYSIVVLRTRACRKCVIYRRFGFQRSRDGVSAGVRESCPALPFDIDIEKTCNSVAAERT